MLPGARGARFLLPIDYPPSTITEPRWGYTRPEHAGLQALFARFESDYVEILSRLREVAPQLGTLQQLQRPEEFSPEVIWNDGEMNGLDLALLYLLLRDYRPARYVEIGSGNSTLLALKAIADFGLETELIAIDPAPRRPLGGLPVKTIHQPLEALVSLALFQDLRPGDIVFFDGTHRAFMSSDVTVFMLDVLPMLAPGVLVHFHDVALPYDYDRYFMLRYWNEQYMLATYLLAAPEKIKVIFPTQYVCRHASMSKLLDPPLIDGINPRYSRQGWSFWFTKLA